MARRTHAPFHASGRRMKYVHGLVLGKFWPLHAGHSHLINTALAQCDRVTVQLLVHPDEDIPLETRASWIREAHPRAHLVCGYDDAPVDFDDPEIWDRHMLVITALLDQPVDAVFTSDPYGAELARRLSAEWVQVDPGRRENAISGTAVRANPEAFWDKLSPAVRAHYVRRVIITGAESTGTTTLAMALAAELGCAWAPEFGRAYSAQRPNRLTAPWRTEEFIHIAETQIANEDAAARSTPNRWLICDTDALATTLWHERYMGHPSEAVIAAAARQTRPFARILTGDEIPFVQDGMRDGEDIRHAIQQRFRDTLSAPEAQTAPWIEVHGSVGQRLDSALAFLNALSSR
jgi:HTH-type transcriptional regulator, transcriptional repressor of NAD biosynthesis genes